MLLPLLAWLASAIWHVAKPLPDGLGVAMPSRPVTEATLLVDRTWTGADGGRRQEHEIFDEVLRMIGQARRLVVLDMFLLNRFGSTAGDGHRPLSDQLVAALVRQREQHPALRAVVITDPVNTVYGGMRSPHLDALQAAGVQVVVTDLAQLPASNPAWSGLWHLCCAWTGNSARGGWLPNPLGEGKVPLRSWLALLNFRANHRKTLVVDHGGDWLALVASGNPHDASSAHGNVALRFGGPAALDLLATEQAVAVMSGTVLADLPPAAPAITAPATGTSVQVLTEGRIGAALLEAVSGTRVGDAIAIDVFYFAHRPLLRALLAAHRRGVAIRVLLDPNRDAFGRVKSGVPNRQVGAELHDAGIPVRWCDTRGEQCHSKLLLVDRADGRDELILGSANFTRRNLDDLNLETSVRLLAPAGDPAMVRALALFDRRWHNTGGEQHSLPWAAYAERSWLRRWRYRIGEATGWSTW